MKYIARPVEVEAHRIIAVNDTQTARCLRIELDNGDVKEGKEVPFSELTARMWPKVGDYWVIQSDGYVYLNPKDVFERKYRPA